MPGHGDACFLAGELFEPVGDLIGDGGVPAVLALAAAGLLVKLDIVHRDRLDKLSDLIEIVGYLGDKDDVGTAADTGVEREPAGVASHKLHDKNTAVRACGGVDIVDDVRRNINGTLEAEGSVRAPDIVIDGLGQGDDVHAGVGDELCALLRTVAAHDDKAVKIEAVIGLEH